MKEKKYSVEVPIGGTWYCWVSATSKAEAKRKVNESHPDVEGIGYEVSRTGKARSAKIIDQGEQ